VRWQDRAKGRRNIILQMMRENGYITDREYAQALEQPLERLHRQRELDGAGHTELGARAGVERRDVVGELAPIGKPSDAPAGVEAHDLAGHKIGISAPRQRGDVELGFGAAIVTGDHARQHGGIELPRVRRHEGDACALDRRARECGEQEGMRVPGADQQDALHRALASSFASSRRRSSFLCTLPVVVMGSASMNSISRGYS
jgi:hypothetical protein